MDGFFIVFLIAASVIITAGVFRCIGKNKSKKVVLKNLHFDYLNDPTDPRSIISPLNPVGPNWGGEENLFRDRHNTTSNHEEQSSSIKNIYRDNERVQK